MRSTASSRQPVVAEVKTVLTKLFSLKESTYVLFGSHVELG